MRITSFAAILLATLLSSSTAFAQETHASLQGFGGLGMANFTTPSTTFGGTITGDLTPNIQVIGEAGRLGNILPSTTQLLFGLSPVGLSASAFYGQGGVRLTSASSSVRPYAEASGGIARLTPHVTGLESGFTGALANLGLSFLNQTAPIGTVGAGVTLHAGNVVADIGYRHHRVFSDNWIEALALGGNLSTNEVRFGVGVKF
jgi:opacity protein-like surface antigen